MQLAGKVLFAATLALVASTGFASRSLLAPAPAPANCRTIVQTARQLDLTTAVIAAEAANLTSTLNNSSTAYTAFIPTNKAFQDASTTLNITAIQILNDPALLLAIMQNHLLASPLTAAELLARRTVDTQYQSSPLNVTSVRNAVQIATPVATARVTQSNVQACQSIVHVVDALLIPRT